MDKAIVAVVRYINGRGNVTVKRFASMKDAYDFVAKLDKRIQNGTCGGYIMTSM